jgi:hypothetical protein
LASFTFQSKLNYNRGNRMPLGEKTMRTTTTLTGLTLAACIAITTLGGAVSASPLAITTPSVTHTLAPGADDTVITEDE